MEDSNGTEGINERERNDRMEGSNVIVMERQSNGKKLLEWNKIIGSKGRKY
jgi:hypothetical protein